MTVQDTWIAYLGLGSAAFEDVGDLPGGSGAPDDVDYLVGTASAGLSAEIVVGTTPGGELGGTWASPTVDASHSGSTHAAVQAAAEATAAGALAAHTGDTSDAHDASAISADSTTLVGTGTDVQAVLEELDNGIADHLADTSAAHAASAIAFTPVGSVAATDVQAAIAEVASEASGAPTSRQIISGGGLTGGGDLTTDRTLAVGAGTGITVNADDVAVNYGTTATTACVGNDARLSDSRAPNGSAGGVLDGSYPNPGLAAGVAGAGLTESSDVLAVGAGTGITVNANDVAVNYGNTSTTACVGNDSRLSDARTPTAHAASHKVGAADALFVRKRAAGTSTSGTPNTSFANVTADASSELIFWHVFATQTNAANTQLTVTVTYSDATTTSQATAAATAGSINGNAGGLELSAAGVHTGQTANSAKAVTAIDVKTTGTGTGTRAAVIAAVQIPL